MKHVIALSALLAATSAHAQFALDVPQAELRAKANVIVLRDLKVGDETRISYPAPCARGNALFFKADTKIISGELVGPIVLLRMEPGKRLSVKAGPRFEVNQAASDAALLLAANASTCGADISEDDLIPISTINGKKSAKELLAD